MWSIYRAACLEVYTHRHLVLIYIEKISANQSGSLSVEISGERSLHVYE